MASVAQAAFVDCVLFDPFSLLQDLIATPEVDVGGCQVLQALMVALVIVVADKPADLALQIAGEKVIFQQDPVLQGLMPSFDLALGLGMVGSAANVVHSPVIQPFCQLGGDVTGAIV